MLLSHLSLPFYFFLLSAAMTFEEFKLIQSVHTAGDIQSRFTQFKISRNMALLLPNEGGREYDDLFRAWRDKRRH